MRDIGQLVTEVLGCESKRAIGDWDDDVFQSPSTVTLGGSVVAVSAGGAHTCVILDGSGSGEVKCWGDNAFGQLDGTTNQQNDASIVSASHLVQSVST